MTDVQNRHVEDMVRQCQAAKTAGISLLLTSTNSCTDEPNIFVCSSDDPKVIAELVKLESVGNKSAEDNDDS